MFNLVTEVNGEFVYVRRLNPLQTTSIQLDAMTFRTFEEIDLVKTVVPAVKSFTPIVDAAAFAAILN